MATRSVFGTFFQSNSLVARASSTVRSSSRRSMSCAMSRSRNACSAPCEKAGSLAPRQSRTICQRRSSMVTSTASPSDIPRKPCSRSTIAMKAGGFGSFPAPLSRYIDSSCAWNSSLKSSARRLRKKPKSLLFFSTRLRIHCSCFVYVWLGRHRSIATLRPERGLARRIRGSQLIGPVDLRQLNYGFYGTFKPFGVLGQIRLHAASAKSED